MAATKGEVIALIKALAGSGGGTTNYNNLANKPQINGVTLSGEKSLEELGIDLDSKADIDGYYDNLGAGIADQLAATVTVNDKVPYSHRTSAGNIDTIDTESNRETDEVVGGTISWNQSVINGNFSSNTEWGPSSSSHGTISISDGVCTWTAIDTPSYGYSTGIRQESLPLNTPANHKFFVSAMVYPSISANVGIYVMTGSSGTANSYRCVSSAVANQWNTITGIVTGESEAFARRIKVCYMSEISNIVSGTTLQIKNVQCFDLTQMFGSTIADYVYGLETNTEGAGAAWFRRLFPKIFYAYDAGTLMSVNVSAHKMVGFNLWDEDWEAGNINSSTGRNEPSSERIRSKNYIRIIPDAEYYFVAGETTGTIAARFYDSEKNYIGSRKRNGNVVAYGTAFLPPENAVYFRFATSTSYGTTYNNDICLNYSHNGSRNGEYEPYKQWVYPLDSSLTLHGIPVLDANNKLKYDGDRYLSDGTVERRYARLDSVSGAIGDTVTLTGIDTSATDIISSVGHLAEIGTLSGSDLTLSVALSDASIVYPLATATEESADPYTNPQIVDDWGTEEYVDAEEAAGTRDVAIPCGHDTEYMANLRDKLQHLPNPADANGDYIIRQTNGQMALVAGMSVFPTMPTTDGAYLLICTVADGTPTLSWEAQS